MNRFYLVIRNVPMLSYRTCDNIMSSSGAHRAMRHHRRQSRSDMELLVTIESALG